MVDPLTAKAAVDTTEEKGGGLKETLEATQIALDISEKIYGWLKEDDDPDVIAIIENHTGLTFEKVPGTSAPAHGDWMKTPPAVIGPFKALDDTQEHNLDGSPIAGMDMDGAGAGSISLAIYKEKGKDFANARCIAFYLKKAPGRRFKAGAFIGYGVALTTVATGEYKGSGDNLRSFIENHQTEYSQYSDSGQACEVKSDSLRVSFQPNNETPYYVKFVIR